MQNNSYGLGGGSANSSSSTTAPPNGSMNSFLVRSSLPSGGSVVKNQVVQRNNHRKPESWSVEEVLSWAESTQHGAPLEPAILVVLLRTQLTTAPNFFSKLTKLKTKFGISCSKEWVNTILKSMYYPVLCISYLVFVLVFLENLTFGLRFG